MLKHAPVLIFTLALLTIGAASSLAEDFAMKADYAESCSCSVPCPCTFGESPTRGHCDGNSLVEISEGHWQDANLDGVSVVASFRLGDWVKFYVNQEATDEQIEAVVAFLQHESALGLYFTDDMKILGVEKAPIVVKRDGGMITFSVPESSVEIEMVKGWQDKPIKMLNLNGPMLRDHTEYKSVTLKHQSDDREFSYTNTNGLTSKINISSTE